MQLEHRLSVPAPVDDVWTALLDPERVAPCMPGATLTGVDGDTFTGTVKVKLGPVALTYKGTGRYVERDEQAHRAVIEANAKDTRGGGTVTATITIVLTGDGNTGDGDTADGPATVGTVTTDLTITGKPAQFGRGMISDVGGKILEQFADCLSKKLGPETAPSPTERDVTAAAPMVAPAADVADAATPAPGTTPSAAATPATRSVEAEPIDLMEYAGASALRRIGPVIVLAAIVALAVAVVLRRRGG